MGLYESKSFIIATTCHELDKEVLKCAICKDSFVDPKILPKCGHTACVRCLARSLSDNSKLECPECSTDNTSCLPKRGNVYSLPDSMVAVSVMKFIKNKRIDHGCIEEDDAGQTATNESNNVTKSDASIQTSSRRGARSSKYATYRENIDKKVLSPTVRERIAERNKRENYSE
ncbi:tripartite motif-containing protein 2-like [Glandiceps talaboti]